MAHMSQSAQLRKGAQTTQLRTLTYRTAQLRTTPPLGGCACVVRCAPFPNSSATKVRKRVLGLRSLSGARGRLR